MDANPTGPERLPAGCTPIPGEVYNGFYYGGLTSNLDPMTEWEVREIVAATGDTLGQMERGELDARHGITLYVVHPMRLMTTRTIDDIPKDNRHGDFYQFHTVTGMEDRLGLARKNGKVVWRISIDSMAGPAKPRRGARPAINRLRITKDTDDYFWVSYYRHFRRNQDAEVSHLKCDQLPSLLALLRHLSGAQMANEVLSFRDHHSALSEELVHAGHLSFPKSLPTPRSNMLSHMFDGDPLRVRQFLTDLMPGQDLRLLGSGYYGVAFDWRRGPALPASFFDGAAGRDHQGPPDKVVKVTAQAREAEAAADMARRFGGEPVPGVARFFWVKEVPLPRYGTARKPTLYRLKGTESSKRVLGSLWVVCVERVRPLDSREKSALVLVHGLYEDALRAGTAEEGGRTSVIDGLAADRLKAPTHTWHPIRMLGKDGMELMRRMAAGMDRIDATSRELGIEMEDLNEDNLGWRGDELVAFDL